MGDTLKQSISLFKRIKTMMTIKKLNAAALLRNRQTHLSARSTALEHLPPIGFTPSQQHSKEPAAMTHPPTLATKLLAALTLPTLLAGPFFFSVFN